MITAMQRTATISDDGVYRYTLGRVWGDSGRHALFVMLNPSTADAQVDDPTIRRCIGFAQREGCDGLVVVNLYALRATKPDDLWRCDDPVGPDNNRQIMAELATAQQNNAPVVAAWGAHGKPHRVYAVKQMPGMEHAHALSFTKSGAPGHPLYIRADAPLIPLPNVRKDPR